MQKWSQRAQTSECRWICVTTILIGTLMSGCRERGFNTSEADTMIAGGNLVKMGEPEAYSTVALIQATKEGKYVPFCSGSLISPTVVITAGHCVVGASTGKIFVSFALDARHTTPEATTSRSIQAIIAHPDYVPGDGIPFAPLYRGSDLALLKLSAPAPTGAVPVSVGKENIAGRVGTSVTLAGYGFTQDDGAVNSKDMGLLRKVNVTTLDSRAWQAQSGLLVYSGPAGKGSCSGDSGGPMYAKQGEKRVLVGATKGGAACGDPLSFNDGMYTSLFVYRDWIACSAGVDLDTATDAGRWSPLGCAPTAKICQEMKVRSGVKANIFVPGRGGLRWRDNGQLNSGTAIHVESWMGAWIRFSSPQGLGFAEHSSFEPAEGACSPVEEGGTIVMKAKTVLKQQPVDSSLLEQKTQKCTIEADSKLFVSVVRRSEAMPGHVIVTLKEALPQCDVGPTGFLFEAHAQLPGLLIP